MGTGGADMKNLETRKGPIRFPAFDGRRVKPSQASARPRRQLCLS